MVEFAKYSALDRVIYVVMGNPVIDFASSQNGDSDASPMRAKRDCFKKIMREVRHTNHC